MKRIKIIIPSLILIFLMSASCVEIVEIELDSTFKRLVVYGTVTTEYKRHYVELTTTSDYFYNEEPPPVIGASVTLMINDSLIVLEESEVWPGVYIMPDPFGGEPGDRFELEISNLDVNADGEDEVYSAVTIMPGIARADSISLQKFVTPFFSGYQVALWSPEPPETNFYNFKLARNDELIHTRLSEFSVQPDDFFSNNYISGVPVGFMDDDNEVEAVLPGDLVTLEINSITEAYYEFITEAQNEIFGNNPLFSGPPANVSSNIDGEAVGIFTAFAVERVSRVVPVPAIPQK